MIVITFNPDGLAEYRNDREIIRTDAVILEVTGFELPVMFLVNGVNLLEFTQNQVVLVSNLENHSLEPARRDFTTSWMTMPILNFALNGLEAAIKVYRGETVVFYLPEIGSALRFKPYDDKVEIFSDVNRKIVFTESITLLNAFENFHNEVRNTLRKEVPLLLEHARWGLWLKESDIPITK